MSTWSWSHACMFVLLVLFALCIVGQWMRKRIEIRISFVPYKKANEFARGCFQIMRDLK